MGCDIHMFVETRGDDGWRMAMGEDDSYGTRNYAVFGILAGVRRRGIGPISEPRGLPHDTSDGVSKEHEFWEMDGHSASWLALPEVLAFNWSAHAFAAGTEFPQWAAALPALVNAPADRIRLVFWFDN